MFFIFDRFYFVFCYVLSCQCYEVVAFVFFFGWMFFIQIPEMSLSVVVAFAFSISSSCMSASLASLVVPCHCLPCICALAPFFCSLSSLASGCCFFLGLNVGGSYCSSPGLVCNCAAFWFLRFVLFCVCAVSNLNPNCDSFVALFPSFVNTFLLCLASMVPTRTYM